MSKLNYNYETIMSFKNKVKDHWAEIDSNKFSDFRKKWIEINLLQQQTYTNSLIDLYLDYNEKFNSLSIDTLKKLNATSFARAIVNEFFFDYKENEDIERYFIRKVDKKLFNLWLDCFIVKKDEKQLEVIKKSFTNLINYIEEQVKGNKLNREVKNGIVLFLKLELLNMLKNEAIYTKDIIKLGEEIVSKYPNCIDAHVLLIYAYNREKDYLSVIKHFEERERIDSEKNALNQQDYKIARRNESIWKSFPQKGTIKTVKDYMEATHHKIYSLNYNILMDYSAIHSFATPEMIYSITVWAAKAYLEVKKEEKKAYNMLMTIKENINNVNINKEVKIDCLIYLCSNPLLEVGDRLEIAEELKELDSDLGDKYINLIKNDN